MLSPFFFFFKWFHPTKQTVLIRDSQMAVLAWLGIPASTKKFPCQQNKYFNLMSSSLLECFYELDVNWLDLQHNLNERLKSLIWLLLTADKCS